MSYYLFQIRLAYAHGLFFYVSIIMNLLNTKKIFIKRDSWHTQNLPPANSYFSRCHAYYIAVKLSNAFSKNDDLEIACIRMELVDENLVIDLTENQKLSYGQAGSVLKEIFPGVQGLSSQCVRRFCRKRSISSRVSTEKVTEMVMEASSKVIYAFWIWCMWRNSCRFFYCHFEILPPVFYKAYSFLPLSRSSLL